MKYQWTYDYDRQRVIVFTSGDNILEIICTVDYMNTLLQHTTLEGLVSFARSKLKVTPTDLLPLFHEAAV